MFFNNGSKYTWGHKIILKRKHVLLSKIHILKWTGMQKEASFELGGHSGFFWKQGCWLETLWMWLASNTSHYSVISISSKWTKSLLILNEIDHTGSLSKLWYNISIKWWVISSMPLSQYYVVYTIQVFQWTVLMSLKLNFENI